MTVLKEHHKLDELANSILLEEQITKVLPGLKKDQKTVLLIDYNNLEGTMKNMGVRIDMKSLLSVFSARCNLVDAQLFWSYDFENTAHCNLYDYFTRNGYTVVRKPPITNLQGQLKGNMDVELVIAAMDLPKSIEHVVLFSGDHDFIPLINRLRRDCRTVSVCSTRSVQPPVMRYEVVRAASNFYDLYDLLPKIARWEPTDE